jgi:ABC-type antimicrobial peptide transport system permease subunit
VFCRALATAAVPSSVGVLVGAAAAVAAARWVEAFLYQVRPGDPPTIAGTGLGLLVLAIVAGALSARHAATLDPALTLASE